MAESVPIQKTNGAKRLHEALLAMKSVSPTYPQQGTQYQRTGLDALPLALDLRPDEAVSSKGWELMRAVKIVAEMISDTRHEVESTDFDQNDKAFYLRDLPKITTVLAPHSLGRSWSDIVVGITPEIVANLENLDRVLNDAVWKRS